MMVETYEASGKTVDEAIDNACMLAGTTIENVEIEILELGGKGLFGFGHKDARVRITVEKKEEPEVKRPASTFGKKKPRSEQRRKKPAIEEYELKQVEVVEPVVERAARPAKAQTKAQPKAQTQPRREAEKAAAKAESKRENHAVIITEGQMESEIFAAAQEFMAPIFADLGVAPQYRTEIREGILWIILSGEKLGLLIGRRGETLNAIQYLVNLAVNRHRGERVRLVLDVEGYRESREQTLHTLARKMADKAVKSGRRVELEPMNPHERRIVHIALQNDRRVETASHGEEPYRRVVITAKRHKRGGHGRKEQRGEALPQVIITHDTDEDSQQQ